MRISQLVLIGVVLASTTSVAIAQTEESVVVTATRTAQSLQHSLSSVSVLNRADIERLQPFSVPELLRGLPGVALVSNGGRGKQTSVFMRGMESDHLLVMVDGIKVGSATTGTAALQDLAVDQIERIEVVRGPRASLYGSEALGGVIQIFTRRGSETLTPRASITLASDNSQKLTAGVSGSQGAAWFNLNASAEQTDGYNTCTGLTGTAGCFTNEPDKDGYENQSVSMRAGYDVSDATDIELNLSRTEGENWYDGDFQNEADTLTKLISASVTSQITEQWQLQFKLARSWDHSDNYKDGVSAGRYETLRDAVNLQSNLQLSADTLWSLGIDYLDDKVSSDTAYAVTDRNNRALFSLLQQQLGEHSVEFGLRRDDNQQFGGETTGHLAWGYPVSDSLRLIASYGTAFKAPTFNELYFPGFGNADLQPEESETWELGARGQAFAGDWAVSLFQTDAEKLIAYDAALRAPGNVDDARIQGIELSYRTQLLQWALNTNLTLLDTEQRSGFYQGNALARRAEQVLRIDADRDYGRFALGATVIAESERYDDQANSRQLAGFATLDLRASYQLSTDWSLKGRIINLLDKDYETAAYYPQPGRGFMLTLAYQP